MTRKAAISAASAGAEKLWAGTVDIEPNAKTGAHHHGPVESVIYVVRGRARMRWGERLEFVAEAGPGDSQEPMVVNLDLPDVEPNPEEVHWVDDIHGPPDL